MSSDSDTATSIASEDSLDTQDGIAAAVTRLTATLRERRDARAIARLPDIARLVSASAPWLEEDLELVCRMNLWIFRIDDRFDDPCDADESTLASLAEQCAAVAGGRFVGRLEDPVVRELAEVRRAVAARRSFRAFGPRWLEAVTGVARGMLQEWRWAKAYQNEGPTSLPTLEEYMVVGEESIGLLPHIWLTCLLADDAASAKSSVQLGRMAVIANRCVRLANDLRTAAREEREGGINALVILGHTAPPRSKPSARSVVRASVDASLAELSHLGERPVTRSGRAERAILAITRALCRFYDLRDFSSQSAVPLARRRQSA